MRWLRQLTFVQLVTGKRDEAREPASLRVPAQSRPEAAAEEKETAGQTLNLSRVKPPIVSSELRAEMQARISDFRAHQERFKDARERHFGETLAKLRAKIQAALPPADHGT